VIHIVAGAIALITGLIAMLSKKGGKRHRLNGKIYFWSMAVIFVTAVHMSFYKNIIFLLLIAFFSFQGAFNGYRILYLKKLHEGQKPERIDWIALAIGAIASVAMMAFGIYVLTIEWQTGIILLVFGSFYTSGVWREYKKFTNPPAGKMYWYYSHIGQMGGAYIATITAFLVNNAHWASFIPGIVFWLLPAAIGVPMIYSTIAKYKKLYAPKVQSVQK
jgi:predicted membrane protein DUF2306